MAAPVGQVQALRLDRRSGCGLRVAGVLERARLRGIKLRQRRRELEAAVQRRERRTCFTSRSQAGFPSDTRQCCGAAAG